MNPMENNLKLNIVLLSWLLFPAISFIKPANGQVTIEPGSFITLKEGGSLMIGTDLHIKSNADSSGFFVDQTTDGDVTVTGDITVERYMTADEWHNVASPVSNESTSCFPGTDLIFWYDETLILNDWNFGWVWDTLGPLTVFRGYDVYFESTPVLVSYHATGTQTLNTGAYNIAITSTLSDPTEIDAHKGWNLVGNPYPSPVDWLSPGWNKSDIHDIKYIWDGVNEIYTIFVGGGSPVGINGGTRFIPSNQGFWIQALQTGSFGIQNSVRIGDMSATPDYYKLKPLDYPLVSFVAKGNDRSDEVIIRFIEGSTEGFDLNYDASKLFSPAGKVPQLSLGSGKQALALSTLPGISENLQVNLNFSCGQEGYYNIGLSDRSSLDAGIRVYLMDEREMKFFNLLENDSYWFYHDPSNDSKRFKVCFNPSADLLDDYLSNNQFTVYAVKNIITIVKNTVGQVKANMTVYTMLGQPLYSENLYFKDKSTFTVNYPAGYYIVSIISDHFTTNSKILITY
jgi:hypothetical protein